MHPRIGLLQVVMCFGPLFVSHQEVQAAPLQTTGSRTPLMFQKTGSVRTAWPKLQFEDVGTTKAKLRLSGVENIYVLGPGTDPAPTGFAVLNGTNQDVWLYTTGTSDDDTVYEIPVRGLWHHNRLSPGWPELVGENYQKAIDQITRDILGVNVIYGPEGQPRLFDVRLDRVYLDVTVSGNVAAIPFVG